MIEVIHEVWNLMPWGMVRMIPCIDHRTLSRDGDDKASGLGLFSIANSP